LEEGFSGWVEIIEVCEEELMAYASDALVD
jgi:hypothetical protein